MTKKEHLTGLVFSMVVFGLLAVACWVAGFMGHTHQFLMAVICTLVVISNVIDYKTIKKS